MCKKKVLIILTLIMICVSIYQIMDTYALFESQIIGSSQMPIGKWIVYLNGNNVTQGETQQFNMGNFIINQSPYTELDRIAPGMSGYFDVEIHPKDTQVSVRYDISLDTTSINGLQLKLTNVTEIGNGNVIVRTGENQYTGVILLQNINNSNNDIVRINFEWEHNEEFNNKDTIIGTNSNKKISIPITIKATQYLGEEIVEYSQESEGTEVEKQPEETI